MRWERAALEKSALSPGVSFRVRNQDSRAPVRSASAFGAREILSFLVVEGPLESSVS